MVEQNDPSQKKGEKHRTKKHKDLKKLSAKIVISGSWKDTNFQDFKAVQYFLSYDEN